MSYFSIRFEGARKAAGLPYRMASRMTRQAALPADADSLARQLPKLRSRELAVAGSLALAVILSLIVLKPL